MSEDDTTRVFRRSRSSDSSETKATSSLFDKNTSRKSVADSDSDTKIFRPNSRGRSENNEIQPGASTQDFNVEPVVGWLVIIDGPGKGNFVKLGFGMNSIGRASDSRSILDFGDEEISRQNHAMLTYDNKNKKFYIQHGGGSNLTYLGENPVLQPHEIFGREIITIGNTKLTFIPLCGPSFNWD